jgi:hypothetical protein
MLHRYEAVTLCAMKAKGVTPILNVSDVGESFARRRERTGADAQILMGNLTRRLERRRSPDSSPGLPPASTNAGLKPAATKPGTRCASRNGGKGRCTNIECV